MAGGCRYMPRWGCVLRLLLLPPPLHRQHQHQHTLYLNGYMGVRRCWLVLLFAQPDAAHPTRARASLYHQGLHVVSPNWLWACLYTWQRADEARFPVKAAAANGAASAGVPVPNEAEDVARALAAAGGGGGGTDAAQQQQQPAAQQEAQQQQQQQQQQLQQQQQQPEEQAAQPPEQQQPEKQAEQEAPDAELPRVPTD